MSTGLPIVATQVGGNSELIDDHSTGRLVPAASPEAMADAILEYFDAPPIARQYGQAARGAALQRFSLDRMVSSYVALYDELLHGRTAAPAQVGASG